MLGPAPADEAADQLAQARRSLEVDSRSAAPAAIRLLIKEGSKKSIDAIAEFGAKTRYPAHIILAGKALAEADPKQAARRIEKQMRNFKKFPKYLARLGIMAEQIPGQPGYLILEKLAKDRREMVAAAAIRALGARKEEAARNRLEALVKSKRPQVAAAAAYALSQLAPNQGTMELLFLRVQKGRKARIGDACALALANIKGSGEFGNRALALMLTNSTRESFHALAKLTLWLDYKPDPEILAKALRSPSNVVREMACDVIGSKNVQGFQKTLLTKATTDRNWRSAIAAWLALKRTGIADVVDGIRNNIKKAGEPSYWALQCAQVDPQASLVPTLIRAALDTNDPVRSELAQRALARYKQQRVEIRKALLSAYEKAARSTRGRVEVMPTITQQPATGAPGQANQIPHNL